MSILTGIDDILDEGDTLAPLMQCINLFNDCKTIKEHNKACKLLINILGKHQLNVHNKELFDLDICEYHFFKTYAFGRLNSLTKSVLIYSPPRGGRAAIIHILNAINGFDNLKIEGPGFCCELSDYLFDVYDGTVAFDITNERVLTDFLSKYLKVFQW